MARSSSTLLRDSRSTASSASSRSRRDLRNDVLDVKPEGTAELTRDPATLAASPCFPL
eukprot:CAMPEP_0202868932 /NCGR_PEP_ID=MMETSP1391-20130828/11411_1 /ASSEMBLY_ACC=CAM_ASM_000867 /TAXON_ID=1034604 /ORGANISM="Chlamydomonas leiostraca, Strain SAG 11-49" /LENGTH=57 /DNA_ID=CAMNT_0049549163 /DNA_START=902 /DNA_END=1075 /DNA_ORIENTATION=-